MKGGSPMKRKKDFRQRVRSGEISGKDVRRMLAELACGKVNDCVQLALEENPCLEKLDLRLLAGVKKNDKGLVEILLIDRLKILEKLAEAAEDGETGMETLIQALGSGEEG